MTADDGAILWLSTYPSDLSTTLLYRAPRAGGGFFELSSAADRVRGWGAILLSPTQVIFTAELQFTSKPTIQVTSRF